jgi:DnaJ family protein A protein 5
LRGGTGEPGDEGDNAPYEHNMRVTTADEISRMMGKFRSNVEYSDAPSGFFGFVRETFEQLAKEEEAAADWEGVDVPRYPSFGHKDDSFEDVVRDFYAVWNGFATKKTFAWKDKYRLSDAPDRRVRRLMEKENQKQREAGIREFNEAVRALLLFVRKRDPRYTPNTQTADERARAQRASAKEQAARARAARAAQMEAAVPEWVTKRDTEDEMEEEEEEVEEEHFECVACNKTFKSERQWEAHEKSKKHQKAIKSLKRQMQKENANLNLDADLTGSGDITPMDDDYSGEIDDERADDSVDEVADEVDMVKLDDARPSVDGEKEHPDEEDEDEEDHTDNDTHPTTHAVPSERGDSDSAHETDPSEPSTLDPSSPSATEPTNTPSAPKLGAAAQKRAKRAAKQATLSESDLKNKCKGCDAAFQSKNQLMQHLKDHPKHAALRTVTGGGGAKKKGKRK